MMLMFNEDEEKVEGADDAEGADESTDEGTDDNSGGSSEGTDTEGATGAVEE